MRLPRGAGVLLHPTSLPGPYGVGDIGPQAHDFLGFLSQAGQRWWQVLPLGPTGFGDSPYQSPSSFAGHSLLISPVLLCEEGWLASSEIESHPHDDATHVDFARARALKNRLLRLAFTRFDPNSARFRSFRDENASWLRDYALFEALRVEYDDRPWQEWERGIARREPQTLEAARARISDEVTYHEFLQFAFELQWSALRAVAKLRGIELIGDIPIFVSLQSVDVWTRPELFQLDADGWPTHVAGVPPDAFAATGQRWGNPLYAWDAHEAERFAWWVERFRRTLDRVDLVRLDHFRGFEAYWRIPATAPTAASGEWRHSPGIELLEAVRTSLGKLPLIAEDLGFITPEVDALRERFALPGMKVLLFAFGGGDGANVYLPFSYPQHCIVYTGTHDNDTVVGWFNGTSVSDGAPQNFEDAIYERRFAERFAGTDCAEVHWDFVRMAYASVADTVIIPMQDLLGLGSEARMNVPGFPTGNWRWRLTNDQLKDHHMRERLAELAATYYRFHGTIPTPLRPRRS